MLVLNINGRYLPGQASQSNDCFFTKYGFYAGGDDSNIMVISVKPEDIEGDKLLLLLKDTELNGNNASEEGVLIFRKVEQKKPFT